MHDSPQHQGGRDRRQKVQLSPQSGEIPSTKRHPFVLPDSGAAALLAPATRSNGVQDQG